MARPSKTNIGNFPFDVDFFDNKIMVRIAGEYGVKGEIIAIKLLCAVYRNGYFIKWSIDERALMIRYLPGISPDLLDQVLDRLLKWGFFDEDLFRSAKILTSVEIQKNYFNAIRRRTGLDRSSFPFLLLNPERPKDVSAYNNGVSVYRNGVSVYNNSENVDDNEIYVVGNSNSGNKNPFQSDPIKNPDVAEKEFLYTEMGVSVYKNPDKCNKNPDSGNKNQDSCSKNPLEKHFEAVNEFLHTETGVSVYKKPDLCIQESKGSKNNNSKSVAKTGVSVYKNPNNVSNNGQTDNNNSDSDSNNPPNIIYNSISSCCSSRSSCCNKKSEQKTDFGEQKGKECYQAFDVALNDLKGRKVWRESVCQNHHIDQQELSLLLEKYALHCKAEGNVNHSSLQEIMSHFNRWIPYCDIKTANKTSTNYENNKSKSRVQRRGTEADSKKQKNYHAPL